MGYGAARLPGMVAAESGRQSGPDTRPGVQYVHIVHGQLQPPALQRGNRSELLYPTVRHHAVPVHHGRLRYGSFGRDIQGYGSQDDQVDRELLGIPDPQRHPYPDASVAAGGYPARDKRYAHVLRRQADAYDAGRRHAGDFAGTDGSHRPHQAARYERRRLFRRELFAPAGEPECLHQHARMLVYPYHPDGDGVRAGLLPETP